MAWSANIDEVRLEVLVEDAAVRSSTLELELTNSSVISQVLNDITDHATVVVEQHTVAVGFFTGRLVVFLGGLGLPVDTVEMRVECIDFHDEVVVVLFRE